MIEIPLRHKETGEELLFCAQSKTSLGATRDFLTQARRVPQGFNPVIRLGVGSFKSKLGADQEAGAEYHRQGAVWRCSERKRRTAVQ